MSLRTRLVVALLTGPAVAAIDLTGLYVLVYRAQVAGTKLLLHISTALALGATLAATFYAWRTTRRETSREDHFLATLGTVLGAFFALLIVAFEVPTALLGPKD